MNTIWMPKSETDEYGTVYLTDYAANTKSQCRSKLYHEFLGDDDLDGDSVDENLEQLGWELVELAITEVEDSGATPE